MTPISSAADQILAHPAPVLVFDTCSFLDLFRRDSSRQQPRVPAAEIKAAIELLQLITALPDSAHLVVPELVPGEFADHADRIEEEFEGWFRFHDQNQGWLTKAGGSLGLPPQRPPRFSRWEFGPAAENSLTTCSLRPWSWTATRHAWTVRSRG